MKIVFICQAVDQHDSIQATCVRWIETLARKPQVNRIYVVTLRRGSFTLPANVEVHGIKGASRLTTLFRFYKHIVKALLEEYDCFFIYQGGPYPVLLLPFKLLMGKPIYQWKGHPHISLLMRFCAYFCDTKIFTSTHNAFPLNLPNVKVIGGGIDTEQFCIKRGARTKDLLTVGRIAPVKRLAEMIRALAECNRRYGTSYRLDIYGPSLSKDSKYKDSLEALIQGLDLSDLVFLHGAVQQSELPDILNGHRVFFQMSKTALDRSVLEAMACGLPVISTNPCVEEILPRELRDLLILPEEDLDRQAERIYEVCSLNETRLAETGRMLRDVVVQDHNIVLLCDRILKEMGSGG